MSSGSLRSMDVDADASPTSVKPKARALEELVAGPLPSSTSRLSASSRLIPSAKDFHFFNNFPDYRRQASDIASISVSSLNAISSSASLWGANCRPGFPVDLDDAYDWLVNLNDECLERVGISMDEFKNLREKQEENGVRLGLEDGEGGFQLVYRKKKKGGGSVRGDCSFERDKGFVAAARVKVASRDKKTTALRPKVPFHIPTIPRPQTEFNIIANNSNQPFEHVWLERSADGSRLIHPLEKLSVVDFVDRNVGEGDHTKPSALESTPFKFVEGVKELKELSAKLRDANEFAVDLEHNQYRSYQGLTCLMQISTRDEDFIVDTLKLRIHIGPYLREVFKDPLKKKVMHGADRDILWLQRDFGIYVCNLFDTGQASRVLQLERNSLEYLLHYFCEVSANKEYQNADWRLRPLPYEMLKYAREDTHYLLHIYDLMRSRLIVASTSEMDLLTEVYRRSSEICMQLYEKELFTETSYLYTYGLHEADFDSKQLAVVAALCEWRDSVARAEDESTGYVLPNKALLEIARQMPVSASKLRRLVRSKHHYVERCLNSILNIIRKAIENSAAFEGPSEQLKKARQEVVPGQTLDGVDNSMAMPAEDLMDSTTNHAVLGANSDTDMLSGEVKAAGSMSVKNDKMDEIFQSIPLSDAGCSCRTFSHPERALTPDLEKSDDHRTEALISARTATVQISKKPTHAFGALFGSMSSRSKVNLHGGSSTERDKNESKAEQIKSSLVLPFHSFYNLKPSEQSGPVKSSQSMPENAQQNVSQLSATSKMEEVIPLDNGTKNFESSTESPSSEDGHLKHRDWFPPVPENDSSVGNQPEMTLEAPMSLSDLSTSFQECFKSVNQKMKGSQQSCRPSQESRINFQLKSFDYAAARSNIKFGEEQEEVAAKGDRGRILVHTGGTRKGSELACIYGEGELREFQQPRRRQAFPPSGNRSATYR